MGKKYVYLFSEGNANMRELLGGKGANLAEMTNTSQIGLFKITGESSAAAGVRRIEAVTGLRVLGLIRDANQTLQQAAEALKVSNAQELVGRCGAVMTELKEKDKEIDRLTRKIADAQLESLFENIQQVNGVSLISATINGATSDGLRTIGDKLREQKPNLIAVLASIREGKGTLLAVCGKEAVAKGAHAGNIVREVAALAGGKGGGRPESAMAGVPEIFKIDEALTQLPAVVQKMVRED